MRGCNPVDNGDGTHSVRLTRGYTALIDSEDAELVSRYTWITDYRSEQQIYATAQAGRGARSGKVRMHRLVMGCQPGDGMVIDHISHNGIDNRKCNLRVATKQENCFNSRGKSRRSVSRFKGVREADSGSNEWAVTVGVNSRYVHVGVYADELSAARAANIAYRILHGEYACLNDVSDGPIISHPINRSGYRGVCKQQNGYRVRIWDRFKKGHIPGGLHADPLLAAIEYNDAAYELYGEAANLNFIGTHLTDEAAIRYALALNLSHFPQLTESSK